MTVMRGGVDVTDEISATARRLAIEERARTCDFSEVRNHLRAAILKLNALPRPWMNDCISDSIDAIDAIIAELEKDVS